MPSNFFGYIEDSKDAILVIEAAKLGFVQMIKTRLTPLERHSIKPGSCFIWGQKWTHMQRWTDGKSWSSSKYYKGFFYYNEKPKKNINSSPEPCNLIKKTFTLESDDGLRFQLINYIHKNDEKNQNLIRPSQCPFISYNLRNHFNVTNKPEYQNTTSIDLPIPGETMEGPAILSPINNPHFNYSSGSSSDDITNSFIVKESKLYKTLECSSIFHPLSSEDIKQLSLLPIGL